MKYPRTPHLFGAKGTADDKRMSSRDSETMIAHDSLIVEEKLDGTNVGIHFASGGELVLQCRGHLVTEGMHPQYDLFKQWATTKSRVLEERLERRYILYGEWVYAKHTIFYQQLSHYFFEFDIYDKQDECFLDLRTRLKLLEESGIQSVPVIHQGRIRRQVLEKLIGPSEFDSQFENPITMQIDNLMEGLYVRTETRGKVLQRAKMVRPEFVEKIKQSNHWQKEAMVANELADNVDIWEE